MDTASLIGIIIVIVVAYFLIKFIISPIIRAILGVIIFLILLYLLQRFFSFNLDKTLAPYGISLNINNWLSKLSWILNPINYLINKGASIFHYLWTNVPKT
jgi:membrane-associated PAP2 superfamily phosphatase